MGRAWIYRFQLLGGKRRTFTNVSMFHTCLTDLTMLQALVIV